MAKVPKTWRPPGSRNSQTNKDAERRIGTYPAHLRGIATNRYGGNNLQHERGLRGGTYGAAGAARTYSEAQRKTYESNLRLCGELQ